MLGVRKMSRVVELGESSERNTDISCCWIARVLLCSCGLVGVVGELSVPSRLWGPGASRIGSILVEPLRKSVMSVPHPTKIRRSYNSKPRYLQKPSFEVAQASGAFLSPDSGNQAPKDPPGTPAPEVAIDSGVVVFSGEATVALAGLAASDAFKGCTANGVAEGIPALRLELYSDLLLALRTGSSGGDEGDDTKRCLACCLLRSRDDVSGGVFRVICFSGTGVVYVGCRRTCSIVSCRAD